MRTQLLIAAAFGVALLGLTTLLVLHKPAQNDVAYTEDQIQQWKLFKKAYNKRFSDVDGDVEAYRMNVFFANLEFTKNDSTMGVTKFMDLTPAEFAETYLNA